MSNPFDAPVGGSAPGRDDGSMAGLGQRFAAKLIDGFASVLAMAPGLVFVTLDPASADGGDPGPLGMIGVLLFLVGALAVAGYQWYLTSTQGRTIGKGLIGIHMRKVDGSPVDFVSGVVLRSWIVGFAGGMANAISCGLLGWVVPLVDAVVIFGAERRCIHDMLAGTVVLQGPEPAGIRGQGR